MYSYYASPLVILCFCIDLKPEYPLYTAILSQCRVSIWSLLLKVPEFRLNSAKKMYFTLEWTRRTFREGKYKDP